jgi:hypothetical protein
MTGMHHHTQLSVEMGSLEIFYSGWPLARILLISAFGVAGIIGVSHYA